MTPGDRLAQNRTDKLEAIAARFLEAFRTRELPAKLAKIYLTSPSDSVPCRRWSVRNQTITALEGHDDARGFRQWLEVGRHVKKGESAFFILNPVVRAPGLRARPAEEPAEEPGEEANAVRRAVGFRFQAVFGYDQTDGEPLPLYEEQRRKVKALPLLEVARAWEIDVRPQAGIRRLGALGLYHPSEKRISLAVENLSTWAHELVHAAEDRLGQLDGVATEERHVEREVVAQLGAAILLEELGRSRDADLGGSYAYLERHCKSAAAVLATCDRLLKRTLSAVTLLLDTADELAARSSAA